MRHVFNEVLQSTWKHDKRMKVEQQISERSLQQSASLRFLLI